MPGLLDYIPSQSDVQRTLADLVAPVGNRLRGLLSDPKAFLQSALSDVVPTDQQAQEQLSRYRMPLSQDYALGPSGYDNKMRDIALGALTVYHGSPHKFDKFDMSKIGTGEGAQAYGHGLYFAESPEVAKSYANTKIAYDKVASKNEKGWSALVEGEARRYFPTKTQAEEYAYQRAVELSGKPSIYKVDIPDESIAKMLDWDKPLSQQAPEVQKLLEPLGYSSKAQVAAHDDALMAALLGDGPTTLPKIKDPMGSDIARGTGLFDGPAQVEKAKRLRELGIPGIRYLDSGSRNAGKGTYNYVVFDDALPTILERNGQKLK